MTTRTRLTANLDLYVSLSGSDTTGDGSSGTPWATGTHAWEMLRDEYDLAGKLVTVHVDGTTATGILCEGPLVGGRGAKSVTFLGTPANQGCTTTFSGKWGAEFGIKNFTLAGNVGINCDEARIWYYSINFGNTSGAHINASGGNSIVTGMDNASWISGGGLFHAVAENLAQINEASHNMTIGGAGITFSIAYCQSDQGAIVNLQGTIWGGYSFTGVRYIAITNGNIATGQTANWIPGSIAGIVASGGQFS